MTTSVEVQDKNGNDIIEGDFVYTKFRGGSHEGKVETIVKDQAGAQHEGVASYPKKCSTQAFQQTPHSLVMANAISTQPPPPLKYDSLQTTGALRASWISDPTQNCPVSPSQLTMQNMTKAGWGIRHEKRHFPPDQIYEEAVELGLSGEKIYRKIVLWKSGVSRGQYWVNDYMLQTGPGVIFAMDSFRPDSTYWAQIAQAVYQDEHPIADLKYVFQCNIISPETMLFVQKSIYVASNGLGWPDDRLHVWEENTAEYQALLGTRLAKGVAYLVLGAFPRGKRRIVRIVTWGGRYIPYIQMRFDIEKV
ncbi:unnamed protein product [Penicillium glandicola]